MFEWSLLSFVKALGLLMPEDGLEEPEIDEEYSDQDRDAEKGKPLEHLKRVVVERKTPFPRPIYVNTCRFSDWGTDWHICS